MKTKFMIALFLIAYGVGIDPAQAEPVVVVSARSSVKSLTRDDVVRIFMGRYRHFPDGAVALPFDREIDAPIRAAFYRRLLGKTLDEINAYWAHLRFAGRTQPPLEVDGRDVYLHEVATDPGAIGYADSNDLPRGLRIVLVLPESEK